MPQDTSNGPFMLDLQMHLWLKIYFFSFILTLACPFCCNQVVDTQSWSILDLDSGLICHWYDYILQIPTALTHPRICFKLSVMIRNKINFIFQFFSEVEKLLLLSTTEQTLSELAVKGQKGKCTGCPKNRWPGWIANDVKQCGRNWAMNDWDRWVCLVIHEFWAVPISFCVSKL